MNPFANEEIMWQRLKDLQREAENSRLFAQTGWQSFARLFRLLTRPVSGPLHALGLKPRWWAMSAEQLGQADPDAHTRVA